MNNQEYEDFEQVYAVDESDDFSNGGGNLIHSKSGEMHPFLCLALLLALPLFFCALIASEVAKSTCLNYGEVFLPLAGISFLGIYFWIRTAPSVENSDSEQYSVSQNLNTKKRNNKKHMLPYAIGKHMSESERNKANDDIELAIEALVKLGFGKRKAVEWVNRGVEDRIEPSNTQGLVVFALTRGASRKQGGLQ